MTTVLDSLIDHFDTAQTNWLDAHVAGLAEDDEEANDNNLLALTLTRNNAALNLAVHVRAVRDFERRIKIPPTEAS